jgi:hypothetical protein
VLQLINTHFGHLLNSLPVAYHRLELFNTRIKEKLQERFPGEDLPAGAERCALFVDGC